jgi:membrane protein
MSGAAVVHRFPHRIALRFVAIRRRHAWIDHVVRAGLRYDEVNGGRLAAAVTYYAFFAVFASGLLGFAVLGYVLGNPTVLGAVQNYLAANLPRLNVQALRNARGAVGIVAFVVLPVAGLFWVDALRSSIRAMWHLEQYPGKFLLRQVIDLGILAGLGILFALSLTVSDGTQALLRWLVVDAGNANDALGRFLLDTVGFIAGIALNTLLAIALLTGLPRIHLPLLRVFPAALLIALGLEILNTIGRIYVQRAEANPAYQVVAGAVGLLIFLSLVNQLILYAAAFTATSNRGRMTDFAVWRRNVSVAPATRTVSPAARPLVSRPAALRRLDRNRTRARPAHRPPGRWH